MQSLETHMGVPEEQLVRLPGPDADPGEWDAVYTKLGRPDTADGYELGTPFVPEGSYDMTGDLKTWAHEFGLTQKQAMGLFERFNAKTQELVQGGQAAVQASAQEAEAAHRAQWGTAYEAKLIQAKAAMRHVGLDGAQIDSVEGNLGLVKLMDMLATAGATLPEHDFIGTTPGGTHFGMTQGQAKARILAIKADPNYTNPDDQTKRAPLVLEMESLHKIAFPG